jgi:hypothetical protein
MRATDVKRARGFNPMTFMVSPGWRDCLSGIFLVAARGHAAAQEGSCWSARSREAARTNELDADERRLIIGSEEGSIPAGCEGSHVPGRGWRRGLTSTHPAPRAEMQRRHDHVSGDRAAQSNDRAWLVAGSCRLGERARGLVTLPVVEAAGAALAVPVADASSCVAASRW